MKQIKFLFKLTALAAVVLFPIFMYISQINMAKTLKDNKEQKKPYLSSKKDSKWQ